MSVRCKDNGPARNHWFCTHEEMRRMNASPRFRPAGFHSVCDPHVVTYQMREGGRTDPTSYRHYPA
jgi:hypothetical protein